MKQYPNRQTFGCYIRTMRFSGLNSKLQFSRLIVDTEKALNGASANLQQANSTIENYLNGK